MKFPRDSERVQRVRDALKEERLDALFCTLPSNVLLLTGYWPIVGTAVAVFTREGFSAVIAPEDEQEFAQAGWADAIGLFQPASLDSITDAPAALREPLRKLGAELALQKARVGYESGACTEPAPYVSIHLYGADRKNLVFSAFPDAQLVHSDELLSRLKSRLTPNEIDQARIACGVAHTAFSIGAENLQPGMTEAEIAARFQVPLSIIGNARDEVKRTGGQVFCMSGPNSADAYAAFQRSTSRHVEPDDLMLVHCNSFTDGFWTDITRTYAFTLDDRKREMFQAILDARDAALRTLAPGIEGCMVDDAVREVLNTHGFGPEFKHPTGHGVGYHAIDHNALPRIHPKSTDILEEGMVFNIEPGLYIDGYGGLRHCDMVAMTDNGCELLTWRDSVQNLLPAPTLRG